VIALTVVVEGLTAGPVASILGLRRPRNRGYIFLGANPLAVYLARRLAASGQQVELIDANPDECRAAEEAGLKVIYGNGLDGRTLARGRADTRGHAVAVTPNESVNLLYARRAMEDFAVRHAVLGVDTRGAGVARSVGEVGARVLFARPVELGTWISRWRRQHVTLVRRRWAPAPGAPAIELARALPPSALPLLLERGGALVLVDDATRPRPGDVVEIALANDVTGGPPELSSPPWQEAPPPAEPPAAERARPAAAPAPA